MLTSRDITIIAVVLGAVAVWLTRRPTTAAPAVAQGVTLMTPEPAGLVFVGGTPSFDERTGTYTPQRLLAFGPSVVQAPGQASPMLY